MFELNLLNCVLKRNLTNATTNISCMILITADKLNCLVNFIELIWLNIYILTYFYSTKEKFITWVLIDTIIFSFTYSTI